MSYSRGMLHPVRGDKMTAVEWNELAKQHGWDGVMEDWEVKLRDRLERELPEGHYDASFRTEGRKFDLLTGKGGQIELEVAMVKALKEWNQDLVRDAFYKVPEDLIKPEPAPKPVYSRISYERIKELISDCLYGKKK